MEQHLINMQLTTRGWEILSEFLKNAQLTEEDRLAVNLALGFGSNQTV